MEAEMNSEMAYYNHMIFVVKHHIFSWKLNRVKICWVIGLPHTKQLFSRD